MSGRLPATSREPEEWAAATVEARRTRERVAAQFAELIVEGDRMGGRGEVATRVKLLVEAERRIERTRARQEQARELGTPIEPHRQEEREDRRALRAAVMDLGVACASWVASMDHALGVADRGAA